MNDFLKDINYLVFTHYVYHSMKCSSYKENEFGIYLCNESIHCSFSFLKDYIVEIKIKEGSGYYLHFEFIDLLEAKRLFDDFLEYLHFHRPIKVLLCCTSAFTSSYFVEILRQYIRTQRERIDIEACHYESLDLKKQDYDLIMLAPQIKYKERQISRQSKVTVIPTNIYATYDYKRLIDLIKKEVFQ